MRSLEFFFFFFFFFFLICSISPRAFANPNPVSVLIQPEFPAPKYVLSGAFAFSMTNLGIIRFDNSTTAQANAALIPVSGPSPPPLPPGAVPFWGSARLENFQFRPAQGQKLLICPLVNMSRTALFSSTPACKVMIMRPFNFSSPVSDAVQVAGSYNTPFPRMLDIREMAEVVFVETLPPASQTNPPSFTVTAISGRAVLCANCTLGSVTGTLGLGSTGRDLSAIFGNYADVLRFLMAIAIFLLAQVFFSLLLTWERRHFQFLQLLLSGLIIMQDIIIVLYMSRSVISGNTDPRVCLGLGSVFHLVVMCCVLWYGAISLSVFFVFAFHGKFERFAYQSSHRMHAIYHVVCWSLALIDFLIVWGIYGANAGWSYGFTGPYSFCWISNSDVLIGAFFVPASIVMIVSLVTTSIVMVQIFRVRKFHDKLTVNSVLELLAIFITCSGGLIALVVMGVLLIVFSDNPNQVLLLISGILFVLQALALWVVVVPRKSNMQLWALFFVCRIGDLQKPQSSFSKKAARAETLNALRNRTTPSTSPGNSSSLSGSDLTRDLTRGDLVTQGAMEV